MSGNKKRHIYAYASIFKQNARSTLASLEREKIKRKQQYKKSCCAYQSTAGSVQCKMAKLANVSAHFWNQTHLTRYTTNHLDH